MYHFAKSSKLKNKTVFWVSDFIIKTLNEQAVYVKSVSQADDESNSVNVASRSVAKNMYERGIDSSDVHVYDDSGDDDNYLTKAFGMSPSTVELDRNIELTDKLGVYNIKYCVHHDHHVCWSLQSIES